MPRPLLPLLPAALAGEVARAGARVRVGFPWWLRPFLLRGVLAVTLGRRVFLGAEVLERGDERLRAVIRHELVHVAQARRLGLVRFFASYARQYVGLRFRGHGHDAAYRAISFEREAFAAESDPA